MRRFALAAIVLLLVGACSASAELGTSDTVGDSPPPASDAPAAPDASSDAAQSPAEGADGETKLYAVGDPIEVTGDFIASDIRVTVSEVKQAKKYGDFSKPAKGNVYLAVKYDYEALEDGATYNPFDWQVFVDDTAVDNFAFVTDGPKPELNSGTLPKGRKASGWVVYEVPAKGKVVLSYGANMFGGDAPTFEVVARKK
jgi:hypothetical protein